MEGFFPPPFLEQSNGEEQKQFFGGERSFGVPSEKSGAYTTLFI